MAYNVYSLPDCKSVLYHPDVGTANLHQCGMGKIVVSAAGDLTSHTTTADGYIVVNKLKTTNGTITLEVPQNSVGDDFLRRWARWARSTASPNRIALGTLTIYDAVAGFTVVCTRLPRTGSPWERSPSMTPSPALRWSAPASACKKSLTGHSTGQGPI